MTKIVTFDMLKDFSIQVATKNNIVFDAVILDDFKDVFSDIMIKSSRQLQVWSQKPWKLVKKMNNLISLYPEHQRNILLISNRVRQMILCLLQEELYNHIVSLSQDKWNKTWSFHELRKNYPKSDTFFRRTFWWDSISKKNMKLFLSVHSDNLDDISENYIPRNTNRYTDNFLRSKFLWFLDSQLGYRHMSDLLYFFGSESLWRTIYQKVKWDSEFSIEKQKAFLVWNISTNQLSAIGRFIWRWSEKQIIRVLNQYIWQESVLSWSPDKLKKWEDVNWYKVWRSVIQALRTYTFALWEDWLYVLVKLMDQEYVSKRFYYNRSSYYWLDVKDATQINDSYEYIPNIDNPDNEDNNIMLAQETSVSISQMKDLLWDNYQLMIDSINSGKDIDPELLQHARFLMKLR